MTELVFRSSWTQFSLENLKVEIHPEYFSPILIWFPLSHFTQKQTFKINFLPYIAYVFCTIFVQTVISFSVMKKGKNEAAWKPLTQE